MSAQCFPTSKRLGATELLNYNSSCFFHRKLVLKFGLDVGSGQSPSFNLNTSTFTAKLAGTYLFNFQSWLDISKPRTQNCNMGLQINGLNNETFYYPRTTDKGKPSSREGNLCCKFQGPPAIGASYKGIIVLHFCIKILRKWSKRWKKEILTSVWSAQHPKTG